MRIFLTEYYVNDISFSGERIEAISWEHAERLGEPYGLNVIGEWQGDIDFETGKIKINPNLN